MHLGIRAAKLSLIIKNAMGAAVTIARNVPMAFKVKALANALAFRHQTMDGQFPTLFQMATIYLNRSVVSVVQAQLQRLATFRHLRHLMGEMTAYGSNLRASGGVVR